MIKKLIWFGPTYSYSGYAVHNRSMIFELLKLGWDIQLIPSEEKIPQGLIGKDLLRSLSIRKPHNRNDTIIINLIPPPAIPQYSAYTILFTTLESKTIHPGYWNRCTLFDQLWFPCKENIKSFRRANWKKSKTFYCPEGVYPDYWSPFNNDYENYKSPYFTFFYNGDWSFRKGVDILIRAYAKAFLPTDPVRLLLLAHYQGEGAESSRQHISTELQEICTQHHITRLPRIEFIYHHIDDANMPSVYNSADVYACPTRGEAWGLPIIQAMSCGLPPIVPTWGGHTDYCNSGNSFLSTIDDFDIMDDKVHLTVDFYKDQLFCFPNLDNFSKLMRYTFNHQDLVRRKGKIARDYVRNFFSWSRSGKIADKRLQQIYETRFRSRVYST